MTGIIEIVKPGAIRELHWHPNANEWQYYIAGKGRMTVFSSHGHAQTEEYALRTSVTCRRASAITSRTSAMRI